MMQDYALLEEFDRPTPCPVIQKIEIDEKFQVDDRMEQDIHIYYNFTGFVELQIRHVLCKVD